MYDRSTTPGADEDKQADSSVAVEDAAITWWSAAPLVDVFRGPLTGVYQGVYLCVCASVMDERSFGTHPYNWDQHPGRYRE